MKQRLIVTFVMILFVFTGCYFPISGRVIDAETLKPIEGAVVLVEWTVTSGVIGLSSSSVYKIIEKETDSEGRFILPGAYNPFINKPYLIVYKKGYRAWRNDSIFPTLKKRHDYSTWERGYTHELYRFKEDDSKEKHYLWMTIGIIGTSFELTPKFEEALTFESKRAQSEIEHQRQIQSR